MHSELVYELFYIDVSLKQLSATCCGVLAPEKCLIVCLSGTVSWICSLCVRKGKVGGGGGVERGVRITERIFFEMRCVVIMGELLSVACHIAMTILLNVFTIVYRHIGQTHTHTQIEAPPLSSHHSKMWNKHSHGSIQVRVVKYYLMPATAFSRINLSDKDASFVASVLMISYSKENEVSRWIRSG